MGKDSAQIEREIAEQRARISRRIDELQLRFKNDVDSVRSEAQERASGTFDNAKSVFSPDGPMQDHPLTMMAGALGVGVLLGIASEGVGSRNGGNGSRSSHDANGSSSGNSAMSGILASLIGPASGTAREELEQLVREGFSTLRGSMREQTKPEVANRDVGVQ